MSDVIRQDAWKEQDDSVLAETILEYIRTGKTQLEAFEAVAERLERTSAACGFRWNSTIRKQYQEQIKQARAERAKIKKDKPKKIDKAATMTENLSVPVVELIEAFRTMEKAIEMLKEENQTLKKKLKERPDIVFGDDFRDMMRIIQKAKEIGVLDKIS